MIKVGVAISESKSAAKKEKKFARRVFKSSTGKTLQNEGEKKDEQTIDTKKSLKDSVKDESKTSVDDTPKNDGSIVGIPESEEVDKILKVNTGGSTINTSQKDASGKRITPKAKIQEVLAQRDQALEHCKRAKKVFLLLRSQRGRQMCLTFLAQIRNNLRNIKRN